MSSTKISTAVIVAAVIIATLYLAICIAFNERYALLMSGVLVFSQIWMIISLRPNSVADMLKKTGVGRIIFACAMTIIISTLAKSEEVITLAVNAPAYFMFLLAAFVSTSRSK